MIPDRSIFDDSAAAFTAGADAQIEAQRYRRGDLFASAVRKWVVPRGHVLDYGCGPGRVSRLLVDNGYCVLGVDPSPMMIEKAKEQPALSKRLTFAPLSNDCLKRNLYDGIVCSSVIEYVRDPEALLHSFRTALRSSGKLFLSYANARSLWRVYSRWRWPESAHFQIQHNVWSYRECEQVLRGGGFTIIDGPRYFDSPFDRYPLFDIIAACELIGTLGLVVAEAPHQPGA